MAVLTALAGLVFAVAPAVPASAAGNGSIGFEGTAVLPTFPCPSPYLYGTNPCNGTLSGGWTGHAAGQVAGGTFDVAWVNTTGLNSSFTYYELNCVEPSTVLGAAHGTGSAAAGPGQIRGDWQSTSGLARDITNVRLTFEFEWSRAGTTAVITFKSFDVVLSIAGLADQHVAIGAYPATATFVPETVDNPHPPTCSQPLTNVQGQVAGEASFLTS
jgi:hypothetical protein